MDTEGMEVSDESHGGGKLLVRQGGSMAGGWELVGWLAA